MSISSSLNRCAHGSSSEPTRGITGSSHSSSGDSPTSVNSNNGADTGLPAEDICPKIVRDLQNETTFFQTWLSSFSLSRDLADWLLPLIVALGLGVYCYLPSSSISEIAHLGRTWAEFGLSFTASILGFLIAGFAILVSMSQPEMMKRMARERHPDNEFSYLKDMLLRLMRVFAEYAFFAIWCIAVKVLAFRSGPMTELVTALQLGANVQKVLVSICFIVAGAGLVYLVTILLSFIFNIYHFVATSIVWAVLEDDTTSSQENTAK